MPVKRSKLKKKANEKIAKFYFDEYFDESMRERIKEFSKIEYTPEGYTPTPHYGFGGNTWGKEALGEILKTEKPKDPVEDWAEKWMKKNV